MIGCVSGVDKENAQPNSPTKQEEAHKKDEQSKDLKEEEKKQETEMIETPPVTTSEQKKSVTTPKPALNNKVETSGTIAHFPVKLVKTIDGDTFKVLYNGREVNVRYLLNDMPKTNHPRLVKQPFGEEAKEMNRQLANSGKLTLEFDIGERFDKYDRLLAYVYVNGKSVQKSLLAAGLGHVAYVYPPNTRHLTPFKESQAIAKKKGIGIWSVEN